MPLFYDKEVRIFWTFCGSDNNNAFLIVCPQTGESIIIDAPLHPGQLLEDAKGTQVRAILITHRHRDHWEGLQEITDATGAPVAVHPADAAALPVAPSRLVEDGDIIRAGTIEMQVLHTPGHTPGSVCYLAGRHLFSGDTLFAGGVGHTPSVEELVQAYESITQKLYTLPDATLLLPGHGTYSFLGVEKAAYREVLAQYPDVLPPIPDTTPHGG